MKPDWMPVAWRELGVHEISGLVNAPRIVEYHQSTSLRATTDEVPWCSAFVNWAMKKAGRNGTGSAAARSWLDWGVPGEHAYGNVVVLSRGIPGSQSGHVGLYVDEDATMIFLLGGNQSDSVRVSPFPLARILDVRAPAV